MLPTNDADRRDENVNEDQNDERKSDLRAEVLLGAALGKIAPDAVGPIFEVLDQGAPLLRPTALDRSLGTKPMCAVEDANGQKLVPGGLYLLDGKKVKVLSEDYGSGNLMDTWYWVRYLDSELHEQTLSVDASFARNDKSIFPRSYYRSRLVPVPKE